MKKFRGVGSTPGADKLQPRPLHILIVSTQLHIGGVERHIVDLANGLQKRGHRIFIAADSGPLEDELHPSVAKHILPFRRLVPLPSLILPSKLRLAYQTWHELHRLQQLERIDLIHAHAVAAGFFARLARTSRHVPVVFSCHGGPETVWPTLGRRIARVGDFYIGVSQDTTQRLKYYTACKPEQIATINYGIKAQLRAFIPTAEKERYRAQWLRHPDGQVVITVARLHEQKGHDTLFQAIPHILAVHPHTTFVCIGGGPLASTYEEFIRDQGLTHVVFMLGEQRDVWPFLQSADIFCLPSRYEALPLSIIEAYVAGLPVVASAVNGVPEIVQEGITGFLVPASDPLALATAINRLLADEVLLKDMAKQVRVYGQSAFFAPESVLDRIEAFYRKVIRCAE